MHFATSHARACALRAVSAAIFLPTLAYANVVNGGYGVRAFANASIYDHSSAGYLSQIIGDTSLQALPSSSHASPLTNTYSRSDTYTIGYDPNTSQYVDVVIPWDSYMNASVSVTSAPGVLHLFASARATLLPPTLSTPDLDNNPLLLNNPLTPWASGEAIAEFQDTLTVTSSSLPFGTPVDLRSNLNVHALLSADTNASYNVNCYLIVGHKNVGSMSNPDPNAPNPNFFSFYQDILNPNSPETLVNYPTAIIHTFVGDQLTFDLNAVAHASAPIGAVSSTNPDIGAIVDMGNTIFLNLDPLTPGASFTTQTGTNYFTPTPEPASLALLELGAIALFRRRTSASRRPSSNVFPGPWRIS